MNEKGKVFWITGLSGAGKTTIGRAFRKLQDENRKVVLLDGDQLREVYGNDLGYEENDRKKIAMRNIRLYKLLSDQGIDVICCNIGMYDEIRDWNRKNIENYIEIYLKVPIEVLVKRDQKGLYSRCLKGEIKNVLGLDLDFEEPKTPNMIIINDGSETPETIAKQIYHTFCTRGE
ncbi:adenylyl-sulfate kinase [Clostridium aminobutyricum]|uniref:adenylyl-sulfate kinase n=1 Tax=Clostridium aminobutyricum TaxID=33953 RepID=UPI003144DDA5